MIKDFLERYVTVVKVGENDISIPCPSCGKGDNHFQISLMKPFAHCFRCGFKTTYVGLVARFKRCSWDEAKEVVWGWKGVIPFKHVEPKETALEEIKLPPQSVWTRRAQSYLDGRGISQGIVKLYGLYFCSVGYFKNRIIIPTYQHGKVVSFQGRTVIDGQKRYLFPKGNKAGKVLFGFDQARKGGKLVVVEGPFDCLSVRQAGYNAVGTFGKKITPDQMKLIEELEPADVVLLYDADADVTKVLDRLQRRVPVKVGGLLEGDPAECQTLEDVIEVHMDWADIQYERAMTAFL